jgi:hypothetical protein
MQALSLQYVVSCVQWFLHHPVYAIADKELTNCITKRNHWITCTFSARFIRDRFVLGEIFLQKRTLYLIGYYSNITPYCFIYYPWMQNDPHDPFRGWNPQTRRVKITNQAYVVWPICPTQEVTLQTCVQVVFISNQPEHSLSWLRSQRFFYVSPRKY